MTRRTEENITLVYDPDLKRPACVLIQAAYGCDHSRLHDLGFDASSWLLAPTPGMRKLSGDRALWERVVKITADAAKAKGEKP